MIFAFVSRVGFINRYQISFLVLFSLIYLVFFIVLYQIFIRDKTSDLSTYIITLGLFLGIIVSFSPISLSDDIFRYLFESQVILNFKNPYEFAPNSLELSSISEQYPWFSQINNPEISSPYPIVSHIVTTLIVIVIGNDVVLWRLATTFLVYLTGVFLIFILDRMGKNKNLVFLWSLNPIVLLEISHSGHNDIIAIFLLILAIWILFRDENPSTSTLIICGILWACSVHAKLFTIVILPFFLFKLKKSGFLAFLGTNIILTVTYILLTINSTSGLQSFFFEWRFNGFLFESVNYLSSILAINLDFRLLFFIIIIIIWGTLIAIFYSRKIYIRERNPFFFAGICLFLLFLFSPVIAPWYILWAIPLFILANRPLWSFWVFSVTIIGSYYFYVCNCVTLNWLAIEYGLVFAILFYEIYYNRNALKSIYLDIKLKLFQTRLIN